MKLVPSLVGGVLLACVLLSAPFVSAEPKAGKAQAGKLRFYVGTYTEGTKSKGIYLLELDQKTGALTSLGAVGEAVNPSFVAIHPSRRYLYAVDEVGAFKEKKSGAVTAFAIDEKTGRLTRLNEQASEGTGPCHLVVDKLGKNVLVANYGGGSVAVLPIEDGGKLAAASSSIQHRGSSVNKDRQEAPHAHSINLDAANRFAFAADLGLDEVLVYRFDAAAGKLTPNDPPAAHVAPGSGPRHFAFHPDGKHAYVINEMLCTVTAFEYDADKGVLKEIQTTSTLGNAKRSPEYSTAEVQVHPSGKFLYGSVRGHNSIAVFAIDPAWGSRLKHLENQPTQGKTPRNFGIDPTGQFLLAANQDTDNIVVFRIDQETGRLRPTGQQAQVPRPVCVKFLPPAGKGTANAAR
jgi:6-phosphogluconolactonase